MSPHYVYRYEIPAHVDCCMKLVMFVGMYIWLFWALGGLYFTAIQRWAHCRVNDTRHCLLRQPITSSTSGSLSPRPRRTILTSFRGETIHWWNDPFPGPPRLVVSQLLCNYLSLQAWVFLATSSWLCGVCRTRRLCLKVSPTWWCRYITHCLGGRGFYSPHYPICITALFASLAAFECLKR